MRGSPRREAPPMAGVAELSSSKRAARGFKAKRPADRSGWRRPGGTAPDLPAAMAVISAASGSPWSNSLSIRSTLGRQVAVKFLYRASDRRMVSAAIRERLVTQTSSVRAAAGAAREVLQARLAVQQNVAVGAREAVQMVANQVVDEAVAALAFGAPHGQQVEARYSRRWPLRRGAPAIRPLTWRAAGPGCRACSRAGRQAFCPPRFRAQGPGSSKDRRRWPAGESVPLPSGAARAATVMVVLPTPPFPMTAMIIGSPSRSRTRADSSSRASTTRSARSTLSVPRPQEGVRSACR